MPTLAAPLDFSKLEARNIRAHQLGSAPSSPVGGQIYYDTGTNTLFWYDANLAAWVSARGGGAPAAHATSHQPGGSDPMAVDAAVGTGSLRTIGTAGTNACAGNDSRLSDSRAPTGAAGGDLTGSTYPNPIIKAQAIDDTKVANANKDGSAGLACMRTLGTSNLQAMAGDKTLATIAPPLTPGASPVSMNGNRLTNVTDPTLGSDAATKNYVDLLQQGLDSHPSVHAATTANIANVLTGAPNTLDGVTLVLGDRILVKDQTTQSGNGIYTITTLGTGANGVWARATDQDTWAEVPSAYVWVEMGTVNADTGWTCTADPGGTIGSTAITWVQFSSAGTAIAGAGLTKTGNTIDAVGTANRITVAADSIDISTAWDGSGQSPGISTLGTITTGIWHGTPIDIIFGGTNAITASAARTNLAAAGYFSSATHAAGTSWSYAQGVHGCRAATGLIVQCQVDSTGAVVLPDITVSSAGLVTITFSVSQTLNTIRTTIIG